MANPIQSKIRNGILALLNYPIGKQMAKVLAHEIQSDKLIEAREVKTLCLADNSLDDHAFYHILKGMC
jgi:hypothetical protein